ncbi:MAG: PilZ domain-containing protein [Deltaproteobacteria bacterium]|nr:PilZ domain-containing protein [Deltaproteobacteria bacterium]
MGDRGRERERSPSEAKGSCSAGPGPDDRLGRGPAIRPRQRGVERRAHPRRQVVAAATVFTDQGCIGPLVVDNLSAGGAILAGHAGPPIDTAARVLLQLPGRALIAMPARVVRSSDGDGGPSFAIAFSNVSAAIEDTIQEAVLSALESSDDPDAGSDQPPFPETAAAGGD